MGNCLTHNKLHAQTRTHEPRCKGEETEKKGKTNSFRGDRKKMVKFKDDVEKGSQEEEGGSCSDRETKAGAVRIRVLVTKEELRQILGYKNGYSSVEHLVSALKLRGRKVSRVLEGESSKHTGWRPSLESIPEDR